MCVCVCVWSVCADSFPVRGDVLTTVMVETSMSAQLGPALTAVNGAKNKSLCLDLLLLKLEKSLEHCECGMRLKS